MSTVIQLFLGAVSGLAFALLVRPAGLRREMFVYAVALAAAALVYVGFAAAGGAAPGWLAVECAGVVLFSAAALLALRGDGRALVLGWAFHPAWDVLIHRGPGSEFVPEWYQVACAGFDLALAVYIAARGGLRGRR